MVIGSRPSAKIFMGLPSSLELSAPPPPPPPPPPPHSEGVSTSLSNHEVDQDDETTLVNSQSNFSQSLPIIELHESEANQKQEKSNFPKSSKNYTLLLVINYACLFLGSVSSSLISKFYFIHKGSSRWISTWVQSAGFPLLLLPIYLPYYLFKSTERRPFSGFTIKLLLLSMVVGVFLGINNLLFSWGTSYLPVSTSSLLLSSQLAFNLILSVIIVKQKVTFTNLNCVVLLTLSSVLLALSSSHDKPKGLTRGKYLVGFFSTLGAGLLFALYLPVMETIYRKVYCYAMVVEMQLVMEIAATVFATVGMAADGGFSDMKVESTMLFDKGPVAYWFTIAGNLIVWQFCFMGTAGMVFLTTSLTGGICMTALMAMNVVAGVVVYGDKFGGVKVVSTVLCVWGFCSYLYGMYVEILKNKKQNQRNRSVERNEILAHSST